MTRIVYIVCFVSILTIPNLSFGHTINGKYASLVSCNFAYSAVREESGYTGTYRVLGEIFTQHFGSSYCPS